ncbi:MAG TPA: hypothetical protein VN931_04580 [Fibrobacteria bacterium]|nr:hypothetical protein [Fibrobacteria bacterium]
MAQPSSLHPGLSRSGSRAPWCLREGANACEMGIRALRAGFLEESRNIFKALIPREQAHPELILALAETELAAGDIHAFEAALDQLPSPCSAGPHAHVLRSEAAFRQGRTARGLALGFACAELFPTDPRSRFQSARLLWLGAQEREAEVVFLSLAGDPEIGSRARVWAVFCGWRQAHFAEVAELLGTLRRDDVVCEGLREFGARSLGIPWEPNEIVAPRIRRLCAEDWESLFLGIGRNRSIPSLRASMV